MIGAIAVAVAVVVEVITIGRNIVVIWLIMEGGNTEHRDYCTCSLLYTDRVYSVYLYTVYVAYCCVSVLCTAGLLCCLLTL